MLIVICGIVIVFLVFAYIPLVLTVKHRDRIISQRRRPVDEVLKDAVAQGRISQEKYEELIDKVHRSMPSLDAPYPLVREIEEL